MAKYFLREKTKPTIFGIWPVGHSDMNPRGVVPRGLDHLHLEWNTKKGSILKTI